MNVTEVVSAADDRKVVGGRVAIVEAGYGVSLINCEREPR